RVCARIWQPEWQPDTVLLYARAVAEFVSHCPTGSGCQGSPNVPRQAPAPGGCEKLWRSGRPWRPYPRREAKGDIGGTRGPPKNVPICLSAICNYSKRTALAVKP